MFLIAVIKITMPLNPIIYIGKKCILIDLHNYKMCSDFKLHVWVIFRSRSMKIGKMHQSSGFYSECVAAFINITQLMWQKSNSS